MDYRVRLPIFEGPLDLLLQLVEREELDITQVSLARVTGDYLQAVQTMPERQPEELAAFLSVASRLLLIKSRLLLPAVAPDEEEDPGEELVRQLQEYRRYRQVAEALGEMDRRGGRAFVRVAPLPELPSRADLGEVALEDLARLVQQILADLRPEPQAPQARAHTVTIQDLMARLEELLAEGRPVPFRRFLKGCRSRVEVVVAFLALLELLRRRRAAVTQEELFGEIIIVSPTAPGS